MVAQAVGGRHVGDVRLVTEIRGAVGRLFDGARGEIVISGGAGTAKTRGILEWIHLRCRNERLRVLLLRKIEESLKTSALITYQEEVLYDFDGKQSVMDGVRFFGGNKLRPAQFVYDGTGSVIVVGGLDNPNRVKSSRWDVVFVNEATELTLNEWEMITGRTDRPSLVAQPPSLVLGDCNPDAPTHWIKQRADEGRLQLWATTHEDNPAMWDRATRQWTASGLRYLERLDALTGVRYQRLRLGKWVAAEGQVYEGWNAAVHLIDRKALPGGDVPASWPRYWSLDFGYVHPFVWQWFATDPDGRAYLYREIYFTHRLVTDHAEQGLALSRNDPRPRAVITDHDAEDRATFERAVHVTTSAAKKDVSPGIQAVANRLKVLPDGKPRLFILRDALVEPDRSLREAGKPTCTADEFDGYIWDTRMGRRKGEDPLKENDHGVDAARYLIVHLDPYTKSKMVRSW